MKYIIIILVLVSFSSCSLLYNKLGGDFDNEPHEIDRLSSSANKLIQKSYEGINPEKLLDLHFHVVGTGTSTDAWVNPAMKKWWKHLGKYNRYRVYMSATDIKNVDNADQEYIQRIVNLHKFLPQRIKSHILAFDYHYKKDGTIDYHHSEFHIPNEHVYSIAKKYPDYFIPVVSVHPYRKDAIKELTKWAKKGVKHIKWLPNAMGIDPSDKSITAFYRVMKKYNMALTSHVGEEKAVEGESFQELGNPLRLKLPLDLGVKVIMSHLSSRGQCDDYENSNKATDCFELFWRMFNTKKYKKNLFSELSSLLIFERIGEPLDRIINHPELHSRIGYGSDYPLPAVNFVYRTGQLQELGYITEKEAEILNEIYDYNPLLFHFVFLRTVRHPKTGQSLTPEAFEVPRGL